MGEPTRLLCVDDERNPYAVDCVILVVHQEPAGG
jgi:hypothetical protein